MVAVSTKHRVHETSERSADESAEFPTYSGQPIRAAQTSGEWTDLVGDLERELERLGPLDERVEPDLHDRRPSAEFDALLGDPQDDVTLTGVDEFPPPPASSPTAIGPFGVSTERAMRTLDPREASIEATRLDLFISPPVAVPEQDVEPVPPSYRTRVGLYFLPREPATEPTLSTASLAAASYDFDDDDGEADRTGPRRALRGTEEAAPPTQRSRRRQRSLVARASAWLKDLFAVR